MKADFAKRRRVMERSQKLGHCVCDPRRPCPCEVFTGQGACPCAGERPAPRGAGEVRLTELVHNAGCASKIAPADLHGVLSRLPAVDDPAVLSGIPAGDDAGIYRLADGLCLVQTVDVMTPCVDDPYTFGRICAANCLSDIYAMGGVPRTALSVLAFPSETLDGQIMYLMMKGAMDTLAQAGVALIGGHSVKDAEIKLGFAITGTISPGKAVENNSAGVGDLLVLTKPLGTGVLSFARQVGRVGNDAAQAAAGEAMAMLNRSAGEAMNEVGASACTDVTGFGLFGHLINLARHSGVTAEIWADALPAFDGVVQALREGVVPGAVERNMEYVGDDITVAPGVEEALVHLGFDAQTSGGLLIAVPRQRHAALVAGLAARGVLAASIGRIVETSSGRIVLTRTGQKEMSEMTGEEKSQVHGPGCCAEAGEATSTVSAAQKAFGELMRATASAGAIDERAKELINFALVVFSRCSPCVASHLKKARKLGLSQAQLDEAAWCAIAMGGAPVRMFYEDALRAEQGGPKSCC